MDRTSIAGWWQGLATRERRVLGFGALIVVLVIVYLWLWEPAAVGIRKLQADLPQLYAQDASMRAMAAEATGLRASNGTAAAIPPAQRIAAVRRTLQRAGLWREGAPVAGARSTTGGAGSSTVSTLSVAGTVTTVSTATTTRIEPPEVTAEPNDRVRVRFDDIDYGVWVSWLASTETELAARAGKASVIAVSPKAPVGHVRAEVVLDWSTPAGTGQAARP